MRVGLWRTIVGAGCAVLLAACGGDAEPGGLRAGTIPGGSAAATSVPVVPSGPAEVWPLTFTSCTWRWFDRYDIGVEVPDEVPVGATIEVRATLFEGDVSMVGAVGTLTVSSHGLSIVEVRVGDLPWLDEDNADQLSALAPSPGSMCEVDQVAGASSGVPSGAALDLSYDVDPPSSDGTPLGDLVASVVSPNSSMFPLAGLLWQQPAPGFDTVFLASALALTDMGFARDASCRTVRSSYLGGDFGVRVSQTHGCAPQAPEVGLPDGYVTVTLPDDHWLVTVSGGREDVQRIVDSLQPFDVPGGEAAAGPAVPSADDWLDAWFVAHPGTVELARYPYRDGAVAIVRHSEGVPGMALEQYLDPVTFGQAANFGSGGQMCREFTLGIATTSTSLMPEDDPRGYLFFVTGDPGIRVRLSADGLPGELPLRQVPAGERVGFLDIGAVALQFAQVAVVDDTGDPVPCTQR